MAGFASLHRDLLTGENRSRLLGADCVFLLPDRSLSPAGDRRLKELRSPCAAQNYWPSPGVFALPDFADRLLAEFEFSQQKRGLRRAVLSSLEAVVALMRALPEENPHAVFQRLRRTREIHKLGLSPQTWMEVLREYEADSSPELKSATQDVLFYLQSIAATSELGWLSPWQAVPEAERLIRNQDLSPGAWIRAAERPPGTRHLRFVVPAYRELYPSEHSFLETLSQRFEVVRLEPEARRDAPMDAAAWTRAYPVGQHSEAILWAFRTRRPTAIEVLELLPGTFPLDVPEPPAPRALREAHAFQLWADYAWEGKPEQHPFLYGSRARNLLAREGFDPASDPHLPALCEWLKKRSPSEAAALEEIARFPSAADTLRSWVRLFVDLELFANEEAEAPRLAPHPRLSPKGLPVYSLEDLPLIASPRIFLWSTPEELRSLTDAASAETLSLRLFPSKLLDLLERRGVSVPDPSREATMLTSVFEERLREFPDSLHLLEAPVRPAPLETPSAHVSVHRAPVQGPLRPTGLEAYLRCPYQFYLSQVLRLDRDEEWDPETPPPMARGSWIHQVLEGALDESSPGLRDSAWFLSVLRERIPEFFPLATPAYRKLLEEDARVTSARLALHIERFEKPLADVFPSRELRREETVEGEALGARFKGRIDRHDLLPGGRALLWDYKTGRTSQVKAETLVRHGRLQWFLYREILGLDARSCGGGYLNPLEPSDSRLLFPLEGFPELEAFLARVIEAGYPVTRLSPKSEEAVAKEFQASVEPALAALMRGEFPPEPKKASECERCEFRGLCARPYLSREAT